MNTGRHEAFDRPDLLFYADELGTKQWCDSEGVQSIEGLGSIS